MKKKLLLCMGLVAIIATSVFNVNYALKNEKEKTSISMTLKSTETLAKNKEPKPVWGYKMGTKKCLLDSFYLVMV